MRYMRDGFVWRGRKRMSIRVKQSEVKPLRDKILADQDGVCPLCKTIIKEGEAHLDHNHETGMIRSVLCQKCNLLEGTMLYRFKRSGHVARGTDYVDWVEQLLGYLKQEPTEYEHPSLMSDKWKKFKRLTKVAQVRILTEDLKIELTGKEKKKDLLKIYKKSIK